MGSNMYFQMRALQVGFRTAGVRATMIAGAVVFDVGGVHGNVHPRGRIVVLDILRSQHHVLSHHQSNDLNSGGYKLVDVKYKYINIYI